MYIRTVHETLNIFCLSLINCAKFNGRNQIYASVRILKSLEMQIFIQNIPLFFITIKKGNQVYYIYVYLSAAQLFKMS